MATRLICRFLRAALVFNIAAAKRWSCHLIARRTHKTSFLNRLIIRDRIDLGLAICATIISLLFVPTAQSDPPPTFLPPVQPVTNRIQNIRPRPTRSPIAPDQWNTVPLAGLSEAHPPFPLANPNERPEASHRESLDDVWQAALAADDELKATEAIHAAATFTTAAARAERMPFLKVDGGYEIRTDELSYRLTSPILSAPVDQPFMQREFFEFGARVRVPLYTGGRITHGIESAKHRRLSAEAARDTRLLDLRYHLAQEYVSILRAQDEVTVAQTYAKNLQAHSIDLKAIYDQGRAPRNDLLAAEVALADARYVQVSTHHNLDTAQATYNRRLGRNLSDKTQIQSLRYQPFEADLASSIETAINQRPELKQIAAEAARILQEAELTTADRKAQIYAEGAYVYRENQFQDPQGIGGFRVGMDWKPLDFGRTTNREQSSRHHARASQHRYDHLVSTIRLQVRRAWLDLEETKQRVRVSQKALQQADENTRVTRKRYQNGLSINSDVLRAEHLRVRTYRNYNTAVYDAIMAVIWFERVVGIVRI